MAIKGIDHWVIVAGDLHRTLRFYEGLGFTIAWEKRSGRPDMATIRINGAQKINVHGPEAPTRPGYLGARQDFRDRYETQLLNGERGYTWERLQRSTRPYLLRRLKKDILT